MILSEKTKKSLLELKNTLSKEELNSNVIETFGPIFEIERTIICTFLQGMIETYEKNTDYPESFLYPLKKAYSIILNHITNIDHYKMCKIENLTLGELIDIFLEVKENSSSTNVN